MRIHWIPKDRVEAAKIIFGIVIFIANIRVSARIRDTARYVLHIVACCMLHVACCMLHVACCMLHVACCMLYVVCCMLYVAYCTLCAACCVLRAACMRGV